MASRNPFRGALLARLSGALVLVLASVAAHANIALTVRGVGGELRTNVLAYLSFERYRNSAHLSAATIERLENRVQSEVDSALEPYGYFSPTARLQVARIGPNDWRVILTIDRGRPVLVRGIDVRVRGAGADDPLFTRITTRLPFHLGERLNETAYEGLKSRLLQTAATYGYLDGRLTRHELLVNPVRHSARIALTFDTGVRYRFGATEFHQDALTNSLVHRYLRYRQGQPFNLSRVLGTQFVLDDSGYFSNVEVVPGKPDTADHTVPVIVRAKRSRPQVYSIAAGYETDTGAQGIFSWQDRRLDAQGHRMSINLEFAQVTKYSLQSSYVIPMGDPATENLALSARIEQRQLASVDARTVTIGPRFTRVSGRWQTVFFVEAVHATDTVEGTACTAFVGPHFHCVFPQFHNAISSIGNADLVVPGVQISSVPAGYFGEPVLEHDVSTQIRGSRGVLGSPASFLQILVRLERAFALEPRWHLLLREEFGATAASHFDEMPPVMRFFAGGADSVRGFEYNALSPIYTVYAQESKSQCPGRICPLRVQAGGKDVISGTVEIDRSLPHDLGVAAFLDYGNAFNSFHTPHLLQYGAGVGLRVRLPVLTLGVDVGQPLSAPGSPRLYINFLPRL